MLDSNLPPFPGFRNDAFTFLRELARNNDRDWFKPRKATYDDEIVWPLQCLLAEASREAAQRGLALSADPKRAIFRIYRDTRFSKNKEPYKTHAGAVLSRDGSTKSLGGIYVHVEPGQCMVAGGFWHPETTFLKAWRSAMAEDPSAFMEMVEQMDTNGLPVESDEALKRMPAGYETLADHTIAPFMRYKSFTTHRNHPDSDLASTDFAQTLVAFMEQCHPLLAFGWAVEERL